MRNNYFKLSLTFLLATGFVKASSPDRSPKFYEIASYEVEIPLRERLTCADFERGTFVELRWPLVSDAGKGADLARFVGSSFFVEYKGRCRDFADIQGTWKGWVSLDQSEYYIYPVSRDPEDNEPTFIRQVTLHLHLGPQGVQAGVSGNDKLARLADGSLQWNLPAGNQDSRKMKDKVEERARQLEASLPLVGKFQVGETVAVTNPDQVQKDLVKIQSILPNGSASILYFMIYRQDVEVGFPLALLGKKVPVFQGFREGQRVRLKEPDYNGKIYYAKILQLFDNGVVQVRYEGASVMELALDLFEAAS